MSHKELMETNGGFLPVIAYGICWGIMIGCSLVAAGMKEALNEKQAGKE